MTIVFAELTGLTREPGVARTGGRCWEGPIRVGDTFTSVLLPSGEQQLVRLTVDSIELYGLAVDQVDAVFTPLITLSGDGLDLLGEGGKLSG